MIVDVDVDVVGDAAQRIRLVLPSKDVLDVCIEFVRSTEYLIVPLYDSLTEFETLHPLNNNQLRPTTNRDRDKLDTAS